MANTWKLMQRIETARHRADLLDARSAELPESWSALLRDVAAQLRELADHTYALETGRGPKSAGPLAWDPHRRA